MTSLIDVIFLLLLFFMLTSTFSRFSEVPLASAGGQTTARAAQDTRTHLVQLLPAGLRLNGQPTDLRALPEALQPDETSMQVRVLVQLTAGTSAQRLTDLLVALRPIAGLQVAVLAS